MTVEITIVLILLLGSVILFVTDKIRMDLVALLVLCILAISEVVTPTVALSGFSNTAVITVWGMFILSSGLAKTGVANLIGRYILQLSGHTEARLIIVIMLTAGVLSAFMNNIGVVALLLPVVMDIAHRTGHSPSRLLMPLAYGALMGGLTTLIGTPPNLLASDALRKSGLEPFHLFDYTPVGVSVLLSGTLFVAFIGRHLLPRKNTKTMATARPQINIRELYALHERMFTMRIPSGSVLAGKTLADSYIGSGLGLTVFAIIRNNQTLSAPKPHTILQADDRLLVSGKMDRILELRGWRELDIEEQTFDPSVLSRGDIELAEFRLSPNSPLSGQALFQTNFRRKYGVNVLAIRSDSKVHRTNLPGIILHSGDYLLVQGRKEKLRALDDNTDFDEKIPVSETDLLRVYQLPERIFSMTIPDESILAGEKLIESRLGDAFGLLVLAIIRDGKTMMIPDPEEKLKAGDQLLVEGKEEYVEILRGLQQLEIERKISPDISDLESQEVGLIEVTLSPRSTLAGKTLRQVSFREKYGLQILAIWRHGEIYRSNLRDIELQHGDAILALGRWENMQQLARDPDFLILTETLQEPLKTQKMPVAAFIMVAILLPVMLGMLPISIAAMAGATLMILTGCLTMEEAYRAIEWKVIFLIAGMLPLGIAMHQTGAADMLAEQVVALGREFGPWGVVIALYLITALSTMVIPTSALIVLMAPIVLQTSAEMGMSPHSLMMAVAMAASASFISPVSHPVNVLVMGPGGYRFNDYVKLGALLAIVVFLIVLTVLPFFWPLFINM